MLSTTQIKYSIKKFTWLYSTKYVHVLNIRHTSCNYDKIHTLTSDSSIFWVGTVMNTKWVTATVHKSGLSPSTGYLVQKNGSCTSAKVGTGPGNCTCEDKFREWGKLLLRNMWDQLTSKIVNAQINLITSSVNYSGSHSFCFSQPSLVHRPISLFDWPGYEAIVSPSHKTSLH